MHEARYLVSGQLAGSGTMGQTQILASFDDSQVGIAPLNGHEEVENAINSADLSFASWKTSSKSVRKELLISISSLVGERSEFLATLMSNEVGKPISWSRAEVVRLSLTFKLAADLLDEPVREQLSLEFDPRGAEYDCFVERFPVGPILAIVPYNWPYNLAAHKIAPALAAGCTIVLKCSPFAPLSTLALAELIHDAGCPAGVLNAVNCDVESAEWAVKDERIKMVSFTGSEKVGWHIKSLVPEKRVVLELGGDASVLVFEDADLSHAASRSALSGFGYAGQVCISAQHVRVQSAIYDQFRALFIEATENISTGNPLDENVVCGPMINPEAADRVMSWIDEAENGGATVLAGGNRIGNVIEPTLIEDVPSGCRLAKEEVFGPVLTLSKFEDSDEAFNLVNSSRFGIHCGVFTKSEDIAEQAFRELEVGGVVINDFPTLRFDNMPYGGVKRSGVGREGVRYAYEEMTETKTMLVRK